MTFNTLLQFWQTAASDLELQITTPYILLLSSGHKLEAEMLVHQFGAIKGMLIFTGYDEVSPYVNEIVDAGYGFSILNEPEEHEDYDKEEYIKLLSDWDWAGDEESRPAWL